MITLAHIRYAAQAIIEGAWRVALYGRYNGRRPFGWTTRNWINHAASGKERIAAFAAREVKKTPIYFAPSLSPKKFDEVTPPAPITFGDGVCETPYTAPSFINIAGMSYGSMSKSAIQAMASGAKKANCWLNSGEGALSPYHLDSGADIVLQIGTGKFGLQHADGTLDEAKLTKAAGHEAVKMIEIKLSQGGKPGKGGYLPAAKVTDEVAKLMGITPGTAAISRARHEEAPDLEALLKWIHQLRSLTGKPVGFKCAATDAKEWSRLCQLLAQHERDYHPDFIAIDGGEAGTGGAPQMLMQAMGLPLLESLPHLHQSLHHYGLRDHIRLVASGGIITPDHAAAALAHGADCLALGRGVMLAMGCVQALQCHRNVCPMGITAHNPLLEARFKVGMDKGQRIANYIRAMREEVQMIAAACGVESVEQLERWNIGTVE